MSVKQYVSVIVTTRNNHDTLDACLKSIKDQTYQSIELIVVDNNSTDDTKVIAERYTKVVLNQGPERSVQRNIGVKHAHGDWILIIDSDMDLKPSVVEACVDVVAGGTQIEAVIIPEESFGEGFWAQCKRLERSYYVGQDTIEAPRFFARDLFLKVGGYSEEMTGGEDWDLSRRVRAATQVGRIDEYIKHNEGRMYFGRTIRKFYYYAQHAEQYLAKNATNSLMTDQSGPLQRYKLFFSQPLKLLKNPFVGVGMLLLKTAEYAGGAAGLIKAKLEQNRTTDDSSV